jgi:hypothetical protein
MNNARNAKMVKASRINRNKAALVKRNLVRRFGNEQGEVRFWNSRWSQYDDGVAPEERYAELLQGNPYVRQEAERRLVLGWHIEDGVHQVLQSIRANPEIYATVQYEVAARLNRADPVFENEVANIMNGI